jgi:hypothetical protein
MHQSYASDLSTMKDKSLNADKTRRNMCIALNLVSWHVLQGPEYIFTISGGYCYIDKDTQAVTCVKPQVILEKVAGTCSLKYTSPTTTFVSHSFTLSSY